MFHDLALSKGDTVVFDSNSPGGTTLAQHASNATSIQKIYSQQWDYVVVQAQSQEPSFPPAQVAQQTFPYARVLDSLITDNDSCTETVFYMTWGKKYGDDGNCASYPAICTFDGVTQRLRDSYIQMANDNHAITAPAGMAWYASWHADTTYNLWVADNSHPSVQGTYLTACTFYATLFRKPCLGASYTSGLPAPTCAYLQNKADRTVFDSLAVWNIGTYDPSSSFTYTNTPGTNSFIFSETPSANFTNYEWNFGDAATSTTSGAHTYADTGTYQVALIVADDCGHADTSFQTIQVANEITALQNFSSNEFTVYPNPASTKIYFSGLKQATELRIFSVEGKLISTQIISTGTDFADVRALCTGIYFAQIQAHGLKTMVRFLKR